MFGSKIGTQNGPSNIPFPKLSWLKILRFRPVTQSSWTSANTSRFHGVTVGGLSFFPFHQVLICYPTVDDSFQFHAKKRVIPKICLLKMSEVSQLAPLNTILEMLVLERPFARTLSKLFLKLNSFKCLKHLHITHLLNCLVWVWFFHHPGIQVKNSKNPGK